MRDSASPARSWPLADALSAIVCVERNQRPPGQSVPKHESAESAFCEGEACGAISVEWDPKAGSYLVRNQSHRTVRLHFRTWPSATEMLLPPASQACLHAETLEYPYRATYDATS
jgi:hypothetical protein